MSGPGVRPPIAVQVPPICSTTSANGRSQAENRPAVTNPARISPRYMSDPTALERIATAAAIDELDQLLEGTP